MRKIAVICICGLTAATLMTGCGSRTGAAEVATSSEASVSSEAGSEASSPAAQTEADPEIGDASSLELGEYKGLKLSKGSEEVTDKELNAEIEKTREMRFEWKEADRAAQLDDQVNIDFVGKKDGVAFDGGTADGYDLILGSGSFIPGFEEGLVGAKKGEKRSLDLTFPENYGNADLAGKAVVFDVTVNQISEKVLPELDDAFAKSIGDFDTIDEFKEETRKNLEGQRTMNVKNQLRVNAMQLAVDGSKIVCASGDIERMIDEQLQYAKDTLEPQGMKLDDYLAMMGTDVEGYKAMIRPDIKEELKTQMVADAIVEKEGLQADAEYEKTLLEGLSVDKDAYIADFGQENFDSMLRKFLVADYLVEQAEITEAK